LKTLIVSSFESTSRRTLNFCRISLDFCYVDYYIDPQLRIGETMRNIVFAMLTALFALSALTAQAQEAEPPAIASAYESVLSMLQIAKSVEDIHRMVETTDSPDWVSISPTGEKTSRSEAEKQLEGLLSIPPGQRPAPLRKVIYASEQGTHASVVYWVYRLTEQGPVGSMVRDSWVQTSDGWRRTMHEKFFPDRLLKLP